MNTKHLIATAALALLGSSAAFAQNNDNDLPYITASQPSTLTRAAVRAEVLQARRDGTLNSLNEMDTPPVVSSVRSRDEVRKEAIAATRSGQTARRLESDH